MPEKKLADRLREAIRLRGYSIRTEVNVPGSNNNPVSAPVRILK